MSYHTPGPWTASYNEDRSWVGVDCGDETDPHQAGVCDIRTDNIDLKDDEAWGRALADARLIAAAPDLLAVCQQLIEDREACGIEEGDPDDPLAIILEMARQAIAKAEGSAE